MSSLCACAREIVPCLSRAEHSATSRPGCLERQNNRSARNKFPICVAFSTRTVLTVGVRTMARQCSAPPSAWGHFGKDEERQFRLIRSKS
jgi:hypothetical protein